jgi:hypothetical protein
LLRNFRSYTRDSPIITVAAKAALPVNLFLHAKALKPAPVCSSARHLRSKMWHLTYAALWESTHAVTHIRPDPITPNPTSRMAHIPIPHDLIPPKTPEMTPFIPTDVTKGTTAFVHVATTIPESSEVTIEEATNREIIVISDATYVASPAAGQHVISLMNEKLHSSDSRLRHMTHRPAGTTAFSSPNLKA